MALITRVSRLFKADMNAVIDQIEEPEILLKQSLRDMQDALAVSEDRLKLMHVQFSQLNDAIVQAEARIPHIEDELQVCLDAENDDLARAVIRRKLENDANTAALIDKRKRLEKQIERQRQLVEAQQQDLTSLRQKAELLSPTETQASFDRNASPVSCEQVEVALLQEKSRRNPT